MQQTIIRQVRKQAEVMDGYGYRLLNGCWVWIPVAMACACGLRDMVRTLLLMMTALSGVELTDDGTSPDVPQLCPSACSCLGNVVDCSQRSLTAVPAGLPLWTETLWVGLMSLFGAVVQNCTQKWSFGMGWHWVWGTLTSFTYYWTRTRICYMGWWRSVICSRDRRHLSISALFSITKDV